MSSEKKGAGPPEENTNAETWGIETAKKLFEDAISLSLGKKKYDFIGEIARDLGTYRDSFKYLKDKFPELKPYHSRLKTVLEANCFSHGKENEINATMAMGNLRSNYNWTDRMDNTSKGDKINKEKTVIKFVKKT